MITQIDRVMGPNSINVCSVGRKYCMQVPRVSAWPAHLTLLTLSRLTVTHSKAGEREQSVTIDYRARPLSYACLGSPLCLARPLRQLSMPRASETSSAEIRRYDSSCQVIGDVISASDKAGECTARVRCLQAQVQPSTVNTPP
ncbi:hypothetical protein J6590_010216 [Homalodisca vitripennis]|nr:hypothetical protein J6590_010216 [Homalodisca vitripennis]